MIGDLSSSGAMPALEALLKFSAGRQKIIAHNIANLTTPEFRPMDVSIEGFQKQLQEAIEDRRSRTGGEHGELRLSASGEVRQGEGGELELRPGTPAKGALMHDRNNRDTERLMQALAENTAVFRVAADLLKSRNDLLKMAMTQRV